MKCKCGCGQEVKEGSIWIQGHHNRCRSMETREKIRRAHIGKITSQETKDKMSVSQRKRNRKVTEGHKKKISDANTGITRSIQTRLKISKAHKGKKLSEEIKKKISKSCKGKNNGQNNGSWIDGRSYFPYCPKFNKWLKEQVKMRDNYICQKCSKTEIENKKKLSIHHIHYDKENCYPDLITLCCECNSEVNFNRDYWEEYFMEILKERNLLNWKPMENKL